MFVVTDDGVIVNEPIQRVASAERLEYAAAHRNGTLSVGASQCPRDQAIALAGVIYSTRFDQPSPYEWPLPQRHFSLQEEPQL